MNMQIYKLLWRGNDIIAKITSITVFSAQDASNEIAAELQGVPDLIIGNYSDGNLVASLLSHKMGVTEVRVILIFIVGLMK